MELQILKARRGDSSAAILLDYYSAYEFFEETASEAAEEKEVPEVKKPRRGRPPKNAPKQEETDEKPVDENKTLKKQRITRKQLKAQMDAYLKEQEDMRRALGLL